MSRHIIDAIDPKHTVTVGYDRPLDNFFADVFSSGEGESDGGPIEWVGGEATVDDMIERVAPYATVSPALRNTLMIEEETGGANCIVDHRRGAEA